MSFLYNHEKIHKRKFNKYKSFEGSIYGCFEIMFKDILYCLHHICTHRMILILYDILKRSWILLQLLFLIIHHFMKLTLRYFNQTLLSLSFKS